MRSLSSFLVIAAATLVIAGCSHGTISEIPAAPTPIAPPIRRLTVTPVGGGNMIVGAAAPITSSGPFPATGGVLGAFAQYMDGSGKYVEARWTTSDAGVIVVADGAFRAMGRGTATITAAAEGMTASETFTVEPGIAGNWSGNYIVDNCQANTGTMHELICAPLTPGRPAGSMPVGVTAPFSLQISKSGSDLTAAAQFGELRGTLTGTDRGLNFLTLKGDLSARTITVTLVHWDAQVKTDVMEGFIGFEVRIAGVTGMAGLTAHLDGVGRR